MWGRYSSAASPAGAGFEAPSVSVSAAEVVWMEEAAAGWPVLIWIEYNPTEPVPTPEVKL